MNKETTNYETDRPQVALENVDFYNDKFSWTIKALVVPAIILVYSIGLPSSAGAIDNSLPKNMPNVAAIKIEVDPRVELIGIVFRLAGNYEFNQGRIRSYVRDIERQFGDFDNHPVVKLAGRLRSTRRMSCDGPMSLSVYIDRDYRPRKTFEQWPWGLDGRWKKQETAEFLEQLRQFAAETKFNEFYKAHSMLYETGIRSCRAVMAQYDLQTWLGEFFGIEEMGDLRLVLGFLNGPSNYGPRFTDSQTHEKYAIIGMPLPDADGNPVFRPRKLETTAHEFCHSFTNPVVDKYMEQLQPAGEKLYTAKAPAMKRIGYQNWQSLMYESVVRACVASYIRNSFELEYLQNYLDSEAGCGFIWTKELSNLLLTYEANRDKYPTFESFFPEFVAFFNEYSKNAAR
ncbi:MAG: DUF4932 domain-containing protein [Planctomycetes bacterium]|nr:DUF4932 domain-containing protein [Planctomycetota bacterium]MBL7143082.1 DUF4932 domain-containing protein [Phycisphaerae bacterium]